MRIILAIVVAAILPAIAQADVDCRIRAMPPATYQSQPLPEVTYRGMPLADLQKLYRRLAGLPSRAPGLSYCADPLGFVYPWGETAEPTIYFPNDVSDRCRREVVEHEEAHVRGWPLNHPGARLQSGPCKSKPAWPTTVQ